MIAPLSCISADLDDLAAARSALLRQIASASDAAAMGLLREAVLATGGCWMIPATTGGAHWPASHLAEISLLGVFASGRTAPELLDNWRRAARRAAERSAP